jgi:hypothetical protein
MVTHGEEKKTFFSQTCERKMEERTLHVAWRDRERNAEKGERYKEPHGGATQS